MWHTWVGRANGRNCFHPSVGIHHKRKSRVVSLWSPSCHSQRKSQRPNSSRPYGSEFSPFFTDKWLLFLHTTPIQPNPHQWAVVFFFPHRTRSCSAPLKEFGLSSFLPAFFQLRHGPWSIAVGVSVSRFLLHSMRVKRDARIAWERLFPDGMPSFRAVIALDFVLGFPFWFLFLIFFWWVVLLFSFRVLCFICCGC